MTVEPQQTLCDPFNRLDLEFGFHTLIGASKSVAALLHTARSIDVSPGDLGCLLDLLTEKAEACQSLAGFNKAV